MYSYYFQRCDRWIEQSEESASIWWMLSDSSLLFGMTLINGILNRFLIL